MRLSVFMLESLKKETLDWSYVTRYLTLTVWMVDVSIRTSESSLNITSSGDARNRDATLEDARAGERMALVCRRGMKQCVQLRKAALGRQRQVDG